MSLSYDPTHLSESLAKRFGDNRALIDVMSEREWSYDTLYQETQNWVRFFSIRQLKQGDSIVWLTKNNIDFFAALFAAKELGLTLLPLNWRESLQVQISVVSLAQPSLIIFEELFESTAIHLQRLHGVPSVSLSSIQNSDSTNAPAEITRLHDDTAPWYLLFTSGTTGAPKAVIYNWTMHLANVENLLGIAPLEDTDCTVSALPHYHTAGINLFALPMLMRGGCVRIYQDANPEQLLNDLVAEAFNVALFVPTLYQKMADLSNFRTVHTCASSFKLLASGGAALNRSLWDAWHEQGVVIQNGCGLTESGPTLFLQSKAEALEFPCAVGNSVCATDVQLVGPDGSIVNEGESGEIWIKGEAVTPGYWRNAKSNARAFRNDWFRTGDVAQFHHHQYHIVDRMNDMFICGGENVYPSEIEEIITKYQGVDEVVVMGESHRIWGETGVAFVVCKPGNFLVEDDILNFCKTRLARYKVPKRIEFVDELPKTATGKIRRGIVQNWVKH
jgi:fatty-acyl-CoA synthase